MSTEKVQIVKRLFRVARARAGMNQSQLAALLGLDSKSYVSEIENRKKPISSHYLAVLLNSGFFLESEIIELIKVSEFEDKGLKERQV